MPSYTLSLKDAVFSLIYIEEFSHDEINEILAFYETPIGQKLAKKTYWAIVKNYPNKEQGKLEHWLFRNPKQNKSYAYPKEVPNSKKAVLDYQVLKKLNNYYLLEIDLKTGRHHQIRSQLAAINCPIKGDLKYGFDRSNKNGSIHLHARSIEFLHPVGKEPLSLIAPPLEDPIWDACL